MARNSRKPSRGKRLKSPSPNTAYEPRQRKEGCLEKTISYLKSLYGAFLELSFICVLLILHELYGDYVFSRLRNSPVKTVSIALVSLLAILKILQVVKSSAHELIGDAGKKKK